MGFKSQTKMLNRQIGVYLTISCLIFNLHIRAVLAGPEGAQVVNGQVAFQQSGYYTGITASDKSIINYSSFNIARPETVQFIQPGSSASVLNRILSANPTNINGTLLANGRVFFVNPAGVYIGNGARINVAQLVASSLNISNADFINGQYNFAGGSGSVINSGSITAEKVYLIAKQVANSGTINCPAGYVVMASGDRVFLGEIGSDVVVEIDVPSLPESAGLIEGSAVLNEGTIEVGDGAMVLAAAGDIYSQAISNVGTLSASSDTGDAGQVKLAAEGGNIDNSGTIEATSNSGVGGEVIAEGDQIINTGTIDVTGTEGGTVDIQADYRLGQFGTIHADGTIGDGGDIDLWAGDAIALTGVSLTTANAGLNGDGGEVIVFSPQTANFWEGAKIQAKGGSASGDGGFVEVSGKESMIFQGGVETTATNGARGALLIDPHDIEIVDVSATVVADNDEFAENAAADVQLSDNFVEAALNGQDLTLQANSDITVTFAVDSSGGTGNLTLQAGRSILVNADVTLDGSFTATTNDSSAIAVNRDNGPAVFTMDDAITIDTTMSDDNITILMSTGVGGLESGDITLENLNAGTGDILVRNHGATAGSDILQASADLLLTADTVALWVSNTSNTTGAIGASGSPILVTSTAAATQVEAAGSGGGIYIASVNANGLELGGADLGGLTGISTTNNGDIDIELTGDDTLTTSEAISANGSGTVTLDASNANGALTIAAAVDSGSGLISLLADDAVTLSGGGTVGAATTGAITITADQDASGTGLLTTGAAIGSADVAGAITITAQTIALGVGTTVTGTSTLALEPPLAATTIGIGDAAAGTFALTAAEIGYLANGFSGITIGRSDTNANITINAITFNDPVTIQAPSGGTTSVDGQITASSGLALNTATIDIDGDVVTTGTLVNLDATTLINLAVDKSITTAAAAGTISGAIDMDVTGTGTVAIAGNLVTTGAANSGGNGSAGGAVTITTNDGVVAVDAITTSGGQGSGTNTGGLAGLVTIDTGTDIITLNDNITAVGGVAAGAGTGGAGGAVTFSDLVTLGAGTSITINTSGGTTTGGTSGVGGAILFSSTLDGTADFAEDLTLDTAGATDGDITFTGIVGATDLGDVTIDDARNVTASAAFSAEQLTQTLGSGTTQLVGVTTARDGLALNTATIDIDENIVTTGALVNLDATTLINLAVDKSITTAAAADSAAISGAIDMDVTGTGTVAILGNLVTTGAAHSAGNGSEGGAVTITTNDGVVAVDAITTTGGQGSGTNTGGAAGDVTINTTADAITLNDNITAVGGAAAGAGTGGAGGAVTFSDLVTLGTGTSITINTSGGTTTGGTSGVGGAILFSSTLDGTTSFTEDMSLTAGTGDITFAGNVGGVTPLGTLAVNSADNVYIQAAFKVSNYVLRGAAMGYAPIGLPTIESFKGLLIELKAIAKVVGVDIEALLPLQRLAEELEEETIQTYLEGAYLHATDL